jgi:hypothetical protein
VYVTKEVEIWIDPADLEGWPFEDVAYDLMPLVDCVKELHDDHHGGSIWMCSHPACFASLDSLRAAMEVLATGKYEHPSMAALHAQMAARREREERANGLYRLPSATLRAAP